ncbi:DUF429 domain-containing protein [Phaeocystidibacter marisrubri]|uniref:DUF429 domain-containing protein n=1 Tax=Phaeocystidibacter marisrubri TaxID=1577780 RepID=A0A6L3ZDX6_9FLAO|nr:DUF429 domain-containing protein [Phaeocystidibacter marisrubri]KAB2815826.1 DUF429 domain-containing protein [Phaeocystidibacter marisrubri]GGH65910.1 hypothetical protein GCM10011318_03360 [Phaeocystidibacter marisrubri]
MSQIRIIGWDAASKWRNNGIFEANYDLKEFNLKEAPKEINVSDLKNILSCPLENTIIAIDMPLAWPIAFQKEWNSNSPRESTTCKRCPKENRPNENIFRRKTEQWVAKEKYINPLEVTAQPLAKAAFKTCKRLSKYFTVDWFEDVIRTNGATSGILEVYPAASLNKSFPVTKKLPKKGSNEYKSEVQRYLSQVDPAFAPAMNKTMNHHQIDALLCIATTIQYLRKECQPPGDTICDDCLFKEGWIWVPFNNSNALNK